jgi:glyceraldehyde 3-phosphate dehydrogenase
MPLRFGINGLGRIGRALLRIAAQRPGLELVAVNDLAPASVLAPLVARDSVHGRFAAPVQADKGALRIHGKAIAALVEPDPRRQAAAHLRGGVRAVVVSANPDPADPTDVTVCLGVNDGSLDLARHRVISNASCTTNCLALVLRVLQERFALRHALTGVVHSYTENQRLLDLPHPDQRRARAAALNMVPTATTAPGALAQVIPELAGRIDGFTVRVPTPAVAMLDLVALLDSPATAADLREAFRTAAQGPLHGLLGTTDEELVSSDFINDPHSAVVDLPLAQTVGPLARVVAWFDNEWGYATRLADLLERLAAGLPA